MSVPWRSIYHVPRSQVWEGSRGGQVGHAHLTLPVGADPVDLGRIKVGPGQSLCKRPYPWYPRPADRHDKRCPKCVERAQRYGIEWPADE
jgi:hypothetical protein